MDTNRFVQFVVCFMFLSSFSQALRCLKGLQNPGDPLLNRTLQCPSSSAVCGRADFEFVPGSGLSSSFDCVERGSCMPKNCASFAGFDGVSLSMCEFKCCDNDLCNNQTLNNISHVEPLTTFPTPPIPEITTTSDSPRRTTTVMVEPPTPDTGAETATGTNILIPIPPGMVCLQGMKVPSVAMPTDTLACISETQVCARASFEIPSFSGVFSFFNCVERSNCTQSKCETFLNLNGLTTSSCEFKCCSFDVCNNRSLSTPGWNPYPTTTTLAMDKTTLTETTTATAITARATTATLTTPVKTVPILRTIYELETSIPVSQGLDITGINTDSTSTTKAEMPERTTSIVQSPTTSPESKSPISQSTMQGEPQATSKSSPATASPATTASLLNIQTTSGVCAATAFSFTLMVAAVLGAIVAANFDQ